MKKVLVVCERYSQNLGDGVIYTAIQDIFEDVNISACSFDLSHRSSFSKSNKMTTEKKQLKDKLASVVCNSGSFGKYIGYLLWYVSKKNSFLYEFKKELDNGVSHVLIGGGQVLTDTPLGFMLKIYLITEACKKENIPYSFVCCGVGKKLSLLSKILYRDSFLGAKYISTRDGVSKKRIEKILGKHTAIKVEVLNDPVFTLDIDKYRSKAVSITKRLGVNIQTFKELNAQEKSAKESDYINFINRVIHESSGKYDEVVLFTNGSQADQNFLNENFNKHEYPNVVILERPIKPEHLIEILLSMSAVICSRMHCGILSYSLNVPFYQLTWDDKINNVWSRFNLDKNLMSMDKLKWIDINDYEMIKNNGEANLQNNYTKDRIKHMVQAV